MSRSKKPKTFYFRSWMINALRGASRRYPPIYEVRNAGKETYYVESKSGKPMKRVRFECTVCHKKVSNKEIRVDHTIGVVGPEGFPLLADGKEDWNTYISRMFCDKANLKLMCIYCHDIKSAEEKAEKKQVRDAKKKA